MIKGQVIQLLLAGFFLPALCGCAGPISEQYRKEARAEHLTFSMALKNPGAYSGETVVWGGYIVETDVSETGSQIIVLETPLGAGDEPKGAVYSQGRFIAGSSKFLDPALYSKGRKITIAGQITGQKTLPLGKTTYAYPVVSVRQIYLWQPRPYVYPYSYYGWGRGPYWDGEPFWDPYWGWPY